MKKLLATAMITLLLLGCKESDKSKDVKDPKKDKTTSTIALATPGCSDLPSIMTRNVSQAQVRNLLSTKGEIICKLCLYKEIEDFHEIQQGIFEGYLKDFWGANLNNVQYYERTWLQIKSLTDTIPCYESYVTFTYDAIKKELAMPSMESYGGSFVDGKTSFSVPLFRSIAKNHRLCDKDIFMFAKAKIDEEVRVVFMVVSGDNEEKIFGFYNISDEPTFNSL
jgi:hypothetical protein